MRHRLIVLCAAAFVAALTGCRGSQDNQGLAEGSYDNPRSNTGAGTAGPGAPPVESAGPGVGNSASQPGTSAGPTLVLVQQGPHAPYVANAAGNALYYVEGDRDGSACTGACTQSWPPVTAGDVQPSGGPGLQGAMIATVTRADGTRQVTFEGRPLYRYAADGGAGATNGDGVKDKFGSWHLAKPSSDAGEAAPGAAPTGTATATGAARAATPSEDAAPSGGR